MGTASLASHRATVARLTPSSVAISEDVKLASSIDILSRHRRRSTGIIAVVAMRQWCHGMTHVRHLSATH